MQQVSHIQEDIRLIIAIGTLIFLCLGVVLVFFLLYFRSNKNKHILEKENMSLSFQQALLQAQLEIQEQTLKNISQEIHDNIGQGLTLAKLNLNAALPKTASPAKEKIINSKELVSKAIADLRDLSRSFDTDYIKEMGLQRAIEYELELLQKTGTLTARLQVEGTTVKLDKQKELILFRIVQETFTNIIKHAEATRLDVSICYGPAMLELLVADNGKGVILTPDKEGNGIRPGLGIRNMHNRAKMIGADFNMSSLPGKGTEISIRIPVTGPADDGHQQVST